MNRAGQQVEVIRVRLVQPLDLGSALAGLGWPAMGAQTVWPSRFAAARLPLGRPGCAYGLA
jgi:hypothetical protein